MPKLSVDKKMINAITRRDTRFGLTDDELLKVHTLASNGMKPGEIMSYLGRSAHAAGIMMGKSEEFKSAFEKGQAMGIHTISNKLFESAKGGNIVAMIFWLKAVAKWTDEPQPQQINNNNNTVQIFAPKVMTDAEWTHWVGQARAVREVEMNKKLVEAESVDVSEFSEMELSELSKHIEDAEE